MIENNDYFGDIGMALSCSFFLKGALEEYKDHIYHVDDDMVCFIYEWNKVLFDLARDSKYKHVVGEIGYNLLKFSSLRKNFAQQCIKDAPDIAVQSLHYALRFDESVRFLKTKYSCDKNLRFVDLGCGLSPLVAVFQMKYNSDDVYCIDIIPEISDLYTNVSYQLCGKIPSFIDWGLAQKMAAKGDLNAIVSVGCLPHMPIQAQKEYMKIINEKFDNFFVEIKYNHRDNIPDSANAFNVPELQSFVDDVKNISDIKTVAYRNSFKYISKFLHAKPNRRDFLINQSRSLFLSR